MRLFSFTKSVWCGVVLLLSLTTASVLIVFCTLALENSPSLYPVFVIAAGSALTVATLHGLLLFLTIEDYTCTLTERATTRQKVTPKTAPFLWRMALADIQKAAKLYWHNLSSHCLVQGREETQVVDIGKASSRH